MGSSKNPSTSPITHLEYPIRILLRHFYYCAMLHLGVRSVLGTHLKRTRKEYGMGCDVNSEIF